MSSLYLDFDTICNTKEKKHNKAKINKITISPLGLVFDFIIIPRTFKR